MAKASVRSSRFPASIFAASPLPRVPTAGKESDLSADRLSRFHATTSTLGGARTQRRGQLDLLVQAKDKLT